MLDSYNFPDMDSYLDTTDVKDAKCMESNIKNGDPVDIASAEYNKDHSDFSNNRVHHTVRIGDQSKHIINQISAGILKGIKI